MTTTVTSKQLIHASPEQIFLAFTHSLLLNQWLCDFSTVTPRPGGRMYLWWNGDFFSAGEYVELVENKSISFIWHARFDPASSTVSVTLVPEKEGTQIILVHSVPEGDEWKDRANGFKKEWDSTLPNLGSLLETGLDRRIYDRPMLGIQISDFNAEIARAGGFPITAGLRLAEAVEGMGAHAAGLTRDDVIVEFNGKTITNDFGTLAAALHGLKGGDKVEVVYYRGAEKRTTNMELSKRPVPNVPWEPQTLAQQVREKYDQGFAILETTFEDVSDREAGFSPAKGEWSAKQTLAHLVHTERNWLANMDDIVGGYERYADDFGGNLISHINATISALRTVRGMLDEMKCLSDEVVSFLANLPPEFILWKGNYINICNTMLNGMLPHTQSHIDQIKNAIAAARK